MTTLDLMAREYENYKWIIKLFTEVNQLQSVLFDASVKNLVLQYVDTKKLYLNKPANLVDWLQVGNAIKSVMSCFSSDTIELKSALVTGGIAEFSRLENTFITADGEIFTRRYFLQALGYLAYKLGFKYKVDPKIDDYVLANDNWSIYPFILCEFDLLADPNFKA